MNGRLARRSAIVGAACVAALVAVYLIALWTHAGQSLEDAVLSAAAAKMPGTDQAALAIRLLSTVGIKTLVAALVGVVVLGVVRGRTRLGWLAAAVIAASALTTEVLQKVVSRPVLLAGGVRREDQSFPSGHTATAMAILAGVVLVVPARHRLLAAVVLAPWSLGMGVATVTAGWHRPSDTLGSDLIVLAYACTAVFLLARLGRVRQTARPRGIRLVAMAGGVLVAAVLAGLLITGLSGFSVSRALVFAAAVGTVATLLALIDGVDLDPSTPSSAPASRGSAGTGSRTPTRRSKRSAPTMEPLPPA
ncbi:membrane-associated phospholipid phosphatase [Hamadaea flava]|nr:membrane-associated phospholipid phosphatase [Hamadaea flava]